MAAILIIALMAQRNNSTPQYSNSRPAVMRSANNGSVNSRRIFRTRNTQRGFGSRLRRF